MDALRLLHQKLCCRNTVTHVEVRSFIQEIIETVFSTGEHVRVELINNIEEALFPVKLAVPLGLITNEIATNAVKHGLREEVVVQA